MKTFDEKNWCIKVTNENVKDVMEYFNTIHNKRYQGNIGELYGISGYFIGFQESIGTFLNTPELTYEEFKKYVLKQPTMKKEIIGYKCPFNMFSGKADKGALFVKVNDSLYQLKDKLHYLLPKEIVEQWEPVYKQEDIELYIGEGSQGSHLKVKITRDGIWADDTRFSIMDAECIYKEFDKTYDIRGYSMKIDRIKIKCTTFKQEEIKRVIDAYKSLQ